MKRGWSAEEVQTEFDRIALILPEELTFMNHGFAAEEDGAAEHLAGGDLAGEHPSQRHSANLIRHLAAGVATRGRRVLDVGCGRGGAASYLLRRGEAAGVLGLDLSAGNIEFCARRHRAPGLHFVLGDAQRLPFAAGSFDVVLCVESGAYYPDIDRFFAEVARVLRREGAFLYADVLPRGLVDERRAALGARFRIARDEDITSGVIAALRGSAPHAAGLVCDVAAGDRRRADELARLLLDRITGALCRYASGAIAYRIWRLHPADPS